MRTIFGITFSLGLFLTLAACGDVGDAPRAETGEALDVTNGQGMALLVDTAQSEISWKAAKVTRAHDGGWELFSGTVFVNGGDVTGVDLTIDMASVWTDTDRLTQHLRSGDFFEVENYPTGSFIADRIVPVDSADATHLVSGNLTLRDVTNSVTFPATIHISPDSVHAVADFIIDRQRWGIDYSGPPDDLIRDEVRILLDIVATDEMPGEEPVAAVE